MSEKRENMSEKRLRLAKTALIEYMRDAEFYHAQIARLILCYKRIKADISRLEVEE